jgi:hypothetical protein
MENIFDVKYPLGKYTKAHPLPKKYKKTRSGGIQFLQQENHIMKKVIRKAPTTNAVPVASTFSLLLAVLGPPHQLCCTYRASIPRLALPHSAFHRGHGRGGVPSAMVKVVFA